jgi:hypothetical protein
MSSQCLFEEIDKPSQIRGTSQWLVSSFKMISAARANHDHDVSEARLAWPLCSSTDVSGVRNGRKEEDSS